LDALRGGKGLPAGKAFYHRGIAGIIEKLANFEIE
jgi:hypothetical protein